MFASCCTCAVLQCVITLCWSVKGWSRLYLTVPAARHSLHHLLPLSWLTREAADGVGEGLIAPRPLHLLQLVGQTGGQRETGETQRGRRTDRSERKTKHFLFLFMTTIQSASHVEPQVIGPLADDTVTRVAVIGHLELEDVVAAGSISVLVEQNTRTCTSCWEHRGMEVSPQYRGRAAVQTQHS